MKWVEIITLRSPGSITKELVDELLTGVDESDAPTDAENRLVEMKTYHHSVVETDLSIHIYWQSETKSQAKSPLGLRVSYALKPLGLLHHSIWIETATREFASSGERNFGDRMKNIFEPNQATQQNRQGREGKNDE